MGLRNRRFRPRSSSSRGAFIFMVIGLLFASVACFIKYGLANHHNYRDLDAVVIRAQVAAEPTKMLEYMSTYKSRLEERGLTEGHFVHWFPTPTDSYALHYETVQSIITRIEELKAYDRNVPALEAAYQSGLDDVRGVLRELEFIASGTTEVENWHFIVLGMLMILLVNDIYRIRVASLNN